MRTTTQIKVGTFNPNFPISEIKFANVNRDLKETHSERFTQKLTSYGWMMPVIISDKNDLIEGHHRVKSAMILKQKTVPVYIVDWIDTNNPKEHLDSIIGLNNGNLTWTTLNYLKEFAQFNDDYRKVYDMYKANTNNITAGNVVNCYFALSNGGNRKFKEGKAQIKDIEFADFLLNNFSNLNKEHGKNKIAAYCVREMIQIGYNKCKKDVDAMTYLFKMYDKMARQNHLAIASIRDFRPIMETYLNEYYMIKKQKM